MKSYIRTNIGAVEEFSPHVAEWHRQALTVATLAQSPLVTGSVYALQSSGVNNNQQFGQGCEIGLGAWMDRVPARHR